MLAALDVDVVALRDHFPADTKDPVFLEKFKEMDIVFISADTSIRTRPAEARLLKDAGKTALFFGSFWGKMKIWPQAEWLIKRWPMIHGVVTERRQGDVRGNQTKRQITDFSAVK